MEKNPMDDPQLASTTIEAASAQPPDEKPADEMINIVESEDERKVREFMEQVVAARSAREKAEQPVPPPPLTERQRNQIEEEQAAGRRAIERNIEARRLQAVPARDPGEGTSKPVFRPADYVPNMSQGNVGARNIEPRE